MRHPIGAFRSSLELDSDNFYTNETKHTICRHMSTQRNKKKNSPSGFAAGAVLL